MPEQEIAIAQATTPRNYKSFEDKLGCRSCTTDNSLWQRHSDVVALLLLVLVGWAIGYSLFGGDVVGIDSQMFSLVVLFVVAKLVGVVVSLIRIPPMVGMLLVGLVMRNVGFINLTSDYRRFAAILRQLALVNIMLPAGLGLDPTVLIKMFWMILNLSLVPVAVEVVGIAIGAFFVLDFPWLWGLLLGLLLAAVSPAVIVPCLFELQDRGYGVDKGVHTLVIAASTLNDITCIAFFGVMIGVIFSTGTLTMQILQAPIVIGLGVAFGATWGVVCIYVPSTVEVYLVTLRTLLLGLGCVLAALGSDSMGYGGAGALGCIVAAFVASFGWRKQGWTFNNPVRANFVLLWKFFEPISFALIGMEVDFSILELDAVLWGTLVMIVPLLLRVITSFATTQCSNLNLKENLFVALCWIPKATVQAALGPVALDLARRQGDEEATVIANSVVIIAVISILITSPLGAILIMELGPRFLHKTPPENEQKNVSNNEEVIENSTL